MSQGFNSMTDPGAYLEHHGIKGQKWGERRFQNEDGSWTAAGRERYGKGGDPRDRVEILPEQKQKTSVTDKIRKANQVVSKVTSAGSKAGMALTAAGLVTGFVPASALGASITAVSAATSKINFAAKIANEVGDSVNTTIKEAKQAETTDGTGKKVAIGALLGAVGTGVGTALGVRNLTDVIRNDRLEMEKSQNKEAELWNEMVFQQNREEQYTDKLNEIFAKENDLKNELLAKDMTIDAAYKYVDDIEFELNSDGLDWKQTMQKELNDAYELLEKAPDVPGKRCVLSPDSDATHQYYVETKEAVQAQIDQMEFIDKIHNVKEDVAHIDTLTQIRQLARDKWSDAKSTLQSVESTTNHFRNHMYETIETRDLLTKAGITTTVALAAVGVGAGIYSYIKNHPKDRPATDGTSTSEPKFKPNSTKKVTTANGSVVTFITDANGETSFRVSMSDSAKNQLHRKPDDYTQKAVDDMVSEALKKLN